MQRSLLPLLALASAFAALVILPYAARAQTLPSGVVGSDPPRADALFVGTPQPPYDPRAAFAPLDLSQSVNLFRSADGAPGANYWQNRADYQIDARLDPKTKTLSGIVTISYTNNSPGPLDVLWIQLDQNAYRQGSRSNDGGGRVRTQFTEGDVLDKVQVAAGDEFADVNFLVSDTRLLVRLPEAVKASGGQIRVRIAYHYTIPGVFGGRTAWSETPGGAIYDIAQWYPRMAVYDDVRGWDPLPYIGNEFYLEYGNFDYAITVPADMIVVGSGMLVNAGEVLTPEQSARLTDARNSDKTIMIRTADEVAASRPSDQTKTWRFHMDHSRDVAFAASRSYIWDAARVNLLGGKTALAQSVYPASSAGDAAWGRSTEYLKFAIEDFSRRWFPYPWPDAINVAGPVGGMEYPAVLFDSASDAGRKLFWITVHEIGHSYFPMIVGSDERRYAWMDEGLNTFIDTFESDAFEGGVYGPKRDQEFAPGAGAPADQIADLIADPKAPPIMTRADSIPSAYGHPVSYFKTAFGLMLLRDDILGPERFDLAFKKYINEWAYKHPQPADFFRTMDSESGEDLSWFWRGWFLNNWAFDLALDPVAYVDGDPKKGATISVSNHGQLVLPAILRVTFEDGAKKDIAIPAETWVQSADHVFNVDSSQPIMSAVIDPDRRLPQKDRSHTVWNAP